MECKKKCSSKPADREGESWDFGPVPVGRTAKRGYQKHIYYMNDEIEQVKSRRTQTGNPVNHIRELEQRP
jgi:hypothetical protein